jgi:DNA-binding transcriptional MerR regulator
MLVPSEASSIDSDRHSNAPSLAAVGSDDFMTFNLRLRLPKMVWEAILRIQANLRSSMKMLDIGEVSQTVGIPASTLRYYDEIGLISSVGRHGLRRQFAPDVLLQLALISMGKSAGFSLEDIAGMFGRDGRPDLPRQELHDRADDLDRQIRELTALRDTLRHVAECPAPSHMECPTFRRLVGVMGRRRSKKAKSRSKASAGLR